MARKHTPVGFEDDGFSKHGRFLETNPWGIPVAQHWTQVGLLFTLIDEFNLAGVVEIGLFRGGLADMLMRRRERFPDFQYLGFQKDGEELDVHVRGEPGVIVADCFAKESLTMIGTLIASAPRPVLVYCDGGDKPREMRQYAPMLRVNDYLLAHDYPGEITEESLRLFGNDFPFMRELEGAFIRQEYGVSLWMRKGQ
jgi:hypothetical protein